MDNPGELIYLCNFKQKYATNECWGANKHVLKVFFLLILLNKEEHCTDKITCHSFAKAGEALFSYCLVKRIKFCVCSQFA